MFGESGERSLNREGRRAQAREAARGSRRARRIMALGSGAVLAASAGGAALVFDASSAHAAVSDTVTTLADSGAGSLRAAILDANANGGGTITFQAGLTGTITLASNLPAITEPLTVTGPGASVLAVDGASNFRVFYLNVPEAVTISGLTLQHSTWAPLGVDNGGTLTADGVALLNNVATQERGGGFFCTGTAQTLSTVALTNSTVTGNSSTGGGGGGYAGNCNVTIANTTIANNSAGTRDGGGLYFEQLGTRAIENSTISGNTAGDNSGGVYIWQGGPTTISNSTISGNTARTDAGAISVSGGASLSLVQSTVTGNTVTAPRHSSSGALYLQGGSCAVSAGQATNGSNNAGRDGGAHDAACEGAGPVSIIGTILWGNTNASDAHSFDISSGGSTATVASDHSLLGTHEPAVTVNDLGGTLTGVDPKLGPLAENGGPTQTFALLAGSPAIDKGPVPLPVFPLNANDQRGTGYTRVVGAAVDIGAFEVQPPPAPPVVVQPAFTG